MSGFTGLFRRTGDTVSATELDAMTDALSHRGPDGRGTWRDGPVGLGHQQLRTTPEAQHDSLPRAGADGNRILTMDARVDNRNVLCNVLGLNSTSTITDSQIFLEAYDTWGPDCFERIVGAFAVVLYDRDRRRVVCARDHMGIKPVCYTLDDDLFAVASEPKAIRTLPAVSDTIDEASVAVFLADSFGNPEATFFGEIYRLPPGQVLVVEPGDHRLRSYWSLDPDRELDLPSDDAYERRFRELFTEAVRCRLRSPTRVASYLSGGLDSTAIACTAQSLLRPGETLRTLSVTHEGYPAADETEYLKSVLDRYEFDAHVLERGGASPFPNLHRRLRHHDAPFYPPLFTVDQWFADELRGPDRRVLLHGIGGDQTLYYGTRYLTELLLDGQLSRFRDELRAVSNVQGRPYRDIALEAVGKPLTPASVHQLWHWLTDVRQSGDEASLLSSEFRITDGYEAESDGEFGPQTNHRVEHYRHLADPEGVFFREVIDADLARFDVEPRYPFYDPRLVEFCLALPADQKMRDGVGRHIARRALSETLPAAVRTRTDKASFVPSWLDGLHRHERRRLYESVIESPRFVTQYVNETALEDAYRRFSDQPSYEDGWTLAKAYAVETWLRSTCEE